MCLDMKKAFDLVPQEAILHKWHLNGVPDNMVNLMRAMFDNASLKVRLSSGLSDPIRILKGVKQGDPISPTSFNLFVNDILAEMDSACGVNVPGLSNKVKGLMYADDSVILADNPDMANRMMNFVDSWAKKNEMFFNASKCCVMEVNAIRLDPLVIKLGSETIPVVSDLCYLGVDINSKLEVSFHVDNKRKKIEKLTSGLTPFFRSSTIPIIFKIKIVRSIIIPKLMYGAELFGFDRASSSCFQRLINNILQTIAGSKANLTAGSVLLHEFNLSHIYDSASYMRTRLFRKASSLNTIFRDLFNSFTNLTRKYKNLSWFHKTSISMAPDALVVSKSQLKARVSNSVLTDKSNPSSAEFYRNLFLTDSRRFIYSSKFLSADSCIGFKSLIQLRCRSFWTAERIARLSLTSDCDEWSNMCPFCNVSDTTEDITHLLLHCNTWKTQRSIMYSKLGNLLQINFSNLNAETSVRVILGGPLHTDDVRRNKSSSKKMVSKWIQEGFSYVVDFLQSIQKNRSTLLWVNYIRGPTLSH